MNKSYLHKREREIYMGVQGYKRKRDRQSELKKIMLHQRERDRERDRERQSTYVQEIGLKKCWCLCVFG